VFTRPAEKWSKQGGALTEEGSFDLGAAVTLSEAGNTAVVGSEGVGPAEPGAASVFTRSGESWIRRTALPGGPGVALSADGGTVLVGSPGAGLGKGAALVFTGAGASWTLQDELPGASFRF